jgi:hypothetical protein
MDERTAIAEQSVFENLEDIKNQLSMHVQEIGTMVALGDEAAMASDEGHKLDIEWCTVFVIIGHIQKMAQEKVNELDKLLAEQRVIERRRLHLNRE